MTANNLNYTSDAAHYVGAKLLTTQEAAAILGLKADTLSVWRSTGRYSGLKYIRAGRLIRYRLQDVLDFCESRTQTHTGEVQK